MLLVLVLMLMIEMIVFVYFVWLNVLVWMLVYYDSDEIVGIVLVLVDDWCVCVGGYNEFECELGKVLWRLVLE